MRLFRPRSCVLLALVLFAAASAVPVRADNVKGHFDRTLQVTGRVDLDVETGSGSITVRPGSSGVVEIHATIYANHGWHEDRDVDDRVRSIESNPPIEQDGNNVRIGRIEDHDLLRNISISYELVVPADTKVRSQTGAGSQSVERINGPVEANSGAGSLHISRIAAETHARTGSGSVDLDSIQGSVRASTGSGSIRAMGIAGGITASTGSGSVRAEQTAAGDVEIETGSGGVEVSGVKGAARISTGSGSITAEGQPAGQWRMHTASGTVTVRLPGEAAFDLEARTSSGHIDSNHPITLVGTISPRELHGKVRGGGVLVELSTSSGNINIE